MTTLVTGGREDNFELRIANSIQGSNPTTRNCIGFLLVEVLIAFVILTGCLTLVAAGFSRHLNVLQLLEKSLCARAAAEDRLIQEAVRRESHVEIPPDSSFAGFDAQLNIQQKTFASEFLKEIQVDEVTSTVSWSHHGQSRSLRLTTGFSAPTKPSQ